MEVDWGDISDSSLLSHPLPQVSRSRYSVMSQASQGSQRSSGFKRSRYSYTRTPAAKRRYVGGMPAPRNSSAYNSLNTTKQIFRFKRHCPVNTFGPLVCNSATVTSAGYNFSLNNVAGYTELTAVFDYYRIKAIKFKVLPDQTSSISTGNVNSTDNIFVQHMVDKNDDTAPATVDELLECQDVVTTSILKPWSHYWSPAFTDATSAGRDGWVSTTNTSLNWYGIKITVPPTNTSTTDFRYQIDVIFYLEFMSPK